MHAINECARELKTADFRTCANVHPQPSQMSQIMDVSALEKKRRVPGAFGRGGGQHKKRPGVGKAAAPQPVPPIPVPEAERWGELPRMEVMSMLEAFEQHDVASNFGSMETSALSDFNLKRCLCFALKKHFWEKTPWAGCERQMMQNKAPGISHTNTHSVTVHIQRMVALSAQAASVTIQFIEISVQITTILQWGVTVCQLLLQFSNR